MTTTLPIAVVGVDFRRASTRWRAAMVLGEGHRRELHDALAAQKGVGFAELATCNRTEWIAVGDDPAWIAQLLRAQALERLGALGEPVPEPYVHVGEAAARHVLRVAVGLESLARGEPHIAKQTHEVFVRAREEGTAGSVLNILETVVGRTVRRAGRTPGRRSTSAGMHRLVADTLAREQIPEGGAVLVVGMGTIGRRVAESLSPRYPVVRVNRTPSEGVRPLSEVLAAPPPHVAVVLCTGAPSPVWTADQIGADTRVVVDLGSPPQVDPAVASRTRLVDLDALVAAHVPAVDTVPFDDAVEAGLEDLHRALGVRALRDLVRTSHDEYRNLTWNALPAALDRANLSPADRQALEAELRELLKEYAGRMLDAVEHLALENG